MAPPRSAVRTLVLASTALCSSALALVSEYSSTAAKISGPVKTVGCVGGAEALSDLLVPSLGEASPVAAAPPASEGGASVVVIDARGGKLDDAGDVDADGVAAMVASDGVVYGVAAAPAAGDLGYLSGLLVALEVELEVRAAEGAPRAPKVVVVVAPGDAGKTVAADLQKVWALAAKPPAFLSADLGAVFAVTVVDSQQTNAAASVEAALAGCGSEGSGAEAVARLKASSLSAKAAVGGKAPKGSEADYAHAPAVAAAAERALSETLPKAARDLGGRLDLGRAFCATLGAECMGVVGDVVEAFDGACAGAAGSFHAAKRAAVEADAKAALRDAFLPGQLALLSELAFDDLKKSLKGLRVAPGMTAESAKMVKAAVKLFEAKAADALKGTGWSAKASKRALELALGDFVTDRLEAAQLGGTHVPDGESGLRKLWPFPVALSFHWLQPAALGRAASSASGLSPADLKRFNVRPEDVGKPSFSIPAAVSKFTKGMISSNSNAPVE